MGRLGELLVILAIVFLLFGSRRLKDFGSDLGAAIKGFKSSVGNDQPAETGGEQHLALDNAAPATVSETSRARSQRVITRFGQSIFIGAVP